MSDGPTRNTASIMLGFLLSFLGISCAMIIGGLLWQRVTARRREELLLAHLHHARHPINLSNKPGVWNVCIRDALSVPELSDYAWEQLHPLALRVTSAIDSGAAVGVARPAKQWKQSPSRSNEPAFQTRTASHSDTVGDGTTLDGCQAAIAMVIAYPSRAIKSELGEFALGIAHMLCSDSDNGPGDARRADA
ncbi:hypothetical protein GY45DRAFT_1345110 [Cubamyces sp. BRFM 1775]|nr:hypothetical protein GY45DRAFT_1345110 [Cubamyces sp. BRFM 1775]